MSEIRQKDAILTLLTSEFHNTGERISIASELLQLLETETIEKTGGESNLVKVIRIIVFEIGLDFDSVLAYLIYNILGKGILIESEAITRFGKEIVSIATGIIRINAVHTRKAAYQSENFRKLLFSMADDIRSILIKLSERMYEIRMMSGVDDEKNRNIAEETAYLYAPLAHRLGLYHVKTELEENTMRFLHADVYHSIEKKLEESKAVREEYIRQFILPVEKMLSDNGMAFKIKGRTKSVSSIWNKMKVQQVDVDGIFDVFAVRIIIDAPPDKEKELCWKVYSLITDLFPPDITRLRDWISMPKNSGYESLHTTVLGPKNKWVEVQIRTNRMDEIAEKGDAAHWKYKSRGGKQDESQWLARIRTMIENPGAESGNTFAIDKMFSGSIFVFTPDGDLKELRKGSTVLDFAFDVHTDVGFHCSGARINRKMAPIKQVLNNGDFVEIITFRNQKPKTDWLEFVTSPRARNKIKRALKDSEYEKHAEGKEMLKKKLAQIKVELTDEALKKMLKHFRLTDYLELFHAVAIMKIDLNEAAALFLPEHKPESFAARPVTCDIPVKYVKGRDALVIDEAAGVSDFKLAKCCNPIFGDPIFGFVTIGSGIKIHRKTCPNAQNMLSRFPYRIVNARWIRTDVGLGYSAIVRVTGNDRLGIMNDITKAISSDMQVDMRSLHASSESGIFNCTAELKVQDVTHLDVVMNKIKKIKGIISVVRVEF